MMWTLRRQRRPFYGNVVRTTGGPAMAVMVSNEAKPQHTFDSAEMGAIAHLYRGEVYRSTIWRTRLDNTTNWSIVTMGIALSTTFSSPEASPLPLLLVGLLLAVFLGMEAHTVTPGLKMWTWGFPSFTNETDARKDPNEQRPYIELWAGVSDEFFHSAKFFALGEVSIPETYTPTVGMSNVTHANENILINLSAEASGVNLQFFSIEPATPLRVTLKRGDAVLFNDAVKADPKNGNRISATIPAGGSGEQVQLTIRTAEGKELIAAETKVKQTPTGTR